MDYIVTGRTYPAKDMLRKAGFTYDAANKQWTGGEDAYTELQRITHASYSRANQKLLAGLQIKEVK